MRFQDKVAYRLGKNYHLKPIFQSVHCIPERLREYDSDFFIVFNTRRQRYEVHSLENPIGTYCLTLPFNELDVRTLHHVWRNDIRMRGKEIFREVERSQEKMNQDEQKAFKNWARDVAKETQSAFAKSAWT